MRNWNDPPNPVRCKLVRVESADTRMPLSTEQSGHSGSDWGSWFESAVPSPDFMTTRDQPSDQDR